MNFNIGGEQFHMDDSLKSDPTWQSIPQKTDYPKGVKSGIIWYICFLPLLGLFLENYAVSKWAGIFLWAAVVLAMILCCFCDFSALKKLAANDIRLKALSKWRWFAPVYVYKRERFCNRETYKGLMLTVFCAAAIMLNGFTQGLAVNVDSVSVILQNSYVANLDNFTGSSSNIIGVQLEEYFGDSAEWDVTKSGNIYTAVCTGEHENDEVSVIFEVEHDGFTYLGCRTTDITVNGNTLNNEEFITIMKRIFIPETLEQTQENS